MKVHLLFSKIIFVIVFFLALPAARATHLVGGEVTYRYLGTSLPGSPPARPFRYELTFSVYVDRNSNFPTGMAEITNITGGIYNGDNNTILQTFSLTPNPQNVQPPLPPGCNPLCLSSVVISLNTMKVIVDLPFNAQGYKIIWQRCCRNNVLNLQNAANAGNSYYTQIPSPIYLNSSPQFTEPAIPFMLSGDTATFLNNAFDPDGDRLVYGFVSPYDGGDGGNLFNPPSSFPTLITIPFAANHAMLSPFGPASVAFINSASGLTKYFAPAGRQGAYVVTIEIKEYRTLPNGVEVLIGTTRRELQLIVKNQGNTPGACPTNASPSFNGGAINLPLINTNIEITEGQAVTFNIGSNDINNDSIRLSASSRVLDGTNGYTGPLATFPTQKGFGNIAGIFNWQTGCGQAGKYDINIKATDNGCPSRVNSIIVSINVLPLKAPTPVTGPTTVCSQFQSQNYTVAGTGGIPAGQLAWKAINGTVLSSTASSASVRWQPGVGVLRLIRSNGVCKDSSSLTVNTFAVENLIITPATATICRGQSLNLSATGSIGGYIWSDQGGVVISNSASISISPTTTTRYVVAATGQACTRYDTIDVQVISPIVGGAGPDRLLCAGDSASIGSTPLPGYTYQWTPATGLSFQNRANPKVALPNNSNTPLIQTYILVATSQPSSCISRDTVTITILRKPQFTLLPTPTNICSGNSLTIGTSPETGTRYRWTPTTGLSSDTIANPTLTPTLAGNFKYALTATNRLTLCQTTDTVRIRVNSNPNFGSLTGSTGLCSSSPTQVGSTPNALFTYSWTPTTGLSNAQISNPFLTIANPTANPITRNYSIRTTNSATGCFTDTVIVFNIQPEFAPNLAGPDRQTCSMQPISVGTNPLPGLTYLWTGQTTNLSNPNIANPVFMDGYAGADSLNVMLILRVSRVGSACFRLDTVRVAVRPLPLANAGPDMVSVCSGRSVVLGTLPVSGLEYRWNTGANLSDSTVARPIFSTISTQIINRKYMLVVRNPNTGCISRDSVIVRVFPLPLVNTGSGFDICRGQSRALGAVPVNGLVYSWSPKLYVSDTSLANPMFSPALSAVAGAVKLRLRVTNTATGCTDTASIVVNILDLPTAQAGPNVVICSADSIRMGVAAQSTRSYLWISRRGGTFSNALVSNPKYTFFNPSLNITITDTLILRVTNTLTGCVAFDTALVRINPRPLAAGIIAPSLRVCPNAQKVVYKAGNILAGQSYLWQISGGTIENGINQADSVAVNWGNTNPAGKVFLSLTNSFGCPAPKDSLTIIINPLLKPLRPRGDSVLCNFEAVATYRSGPFPTNGSVYDWQTNGLGTIINSTTNVATVRWNAVLGGIGKIWVRETNQTNTNFCSGVSDTLRVQILPSPDSSRRILGQNAFCIQTGSKAYRLGSVVDASDSTRYVWTMVQGGSTSTISHLNPYSDSVRASFGQPGTYILSVLQISKKGCIGKLTKDTIVVYPTPTAILPASHQTDICPATLQNYTYKISGSPNASFKWIINGGVITNSNPDSVVLVNWNASEPYSLKVIKTSSFGCISDTLTIPIRLDNARAEFYSVSHSIDEENTTELKFEVINQQNLVAGRRLRIYRRAAAAGQAAGQGWQEIAELNPTQTSYKDLPQNTNLIEYEYKIGIVNSCNIALESPIHNTIVLKGFGNQLEKTSVLNWNKYIGWGQNPGIGYSVLRKIEKRNPEFVVYESAPTPPLSPITQYNFVRKNAGDGFKQCYRIEATNDVQSVQGRKVFSNTICLDFENKLEIFNIITPNGDGKNELWIIENVGLYDNNKVEVYNRWGKRVFEAQNYQNNWGGGSLESGIYFFYIHTPDGAISKKGFLQILK